MTKKRERWPFRGVLIWDAKKEKFTKVKQKTAVVDAPAIITDELPQALLSHADCQYYTSKRKLRDSYKRLGYIETGGERTKPPPPPKANFEEIREDAEKAYYDIKYDRVPISEKERAICTEEERQFQEYVKRNR